jgi:hypothetical protein
MLDRLLGIQVGRPGTRDLALGDGVGGDRPGRDCDVEGAAATGALAFEATSSRPSPLARRLEIARPRPVPPKRRLIDASVWLNDRKSLSMLSGGMPIPVSRTVKCSSIWPSSDGFAASAISATRPASVNSTASLRR